MLGWFNDTKSQRFHNESSTIPQRFHNDSSTSPRFHNNNHASHKATRFISNRSVITMQKGTTKLHNNPKAYAYTIAVATSKIQPIMNCMALIIITDTVFHMFLYLYAGSW